MWSGVGRSRGVYRKQSPAPDPFNDMIDQPQFIVGQSVYRKIKPDEMGILTGIVFRDGFIEYLACFAENDSEKTYQGMELTLEKSFSEKANE